jgi:hypothetical protein
MDALFGSLFAYGLHMIQTIVDQVDGSGETN